MLKPYFDIIHLQSPFFLFEFNLHIAYAFSIILESWYVDKDLCAWVHGPTPYRMIF
jgi:hypothetical protein